MKDKVFAISGANGFIGKNLSGILIEQGAKVAPIHRDLLLAPEALQVFLDQTSPDYIIHLSAFGNHSDQKDIDEIFQVNVVSSYILMTTARHMKDLKGFINISTSSVYGDKEEPMKEDMDCVPFTMYATTKYATELLGKQLHADTGFPVVNVRPFSVYGPGEADFRFIPTMIDKLNKGEKITLVPEPVHDWIYIEDFVSGLTQVINNVDKFVGNSVNIGTGQSYSNDEILRKLEHISGKSTDVDLVASLRSYDTNMWEADISYLVDETGWYPEHNIDEGLLKTYTWYTEEKEETPIKTPGSLKDIMDESLRSVGQEPNWTKPDEK